MSENFVAIDFETAVSHHICAVGIVTVENNIIVEEFYSLIRPPSNQYNWHNTKVHGITAKDTQSSPTFIEIYPQIRKRLTNKLIVAHNESFDRRVLQKTMADNNLDYSELKIAEKWQCTMRLCRTNDKYPSGKLAECCKIEKIKLNHHEALSDARACAKLFLKLN